MVNLLKNQFELLQIETPENGLFPLFYSSNNEISFSHIYAIVQGNAHTIFDLSNSKTDQHEMSHKNDRVIYTKDDDHFSGE